MKKLVRWLVKFTATALICIALMLGIVSFLKIPINLTYLKSPIETLLSTLIEKPVLIEKSIVITTSLTPRFRLAGVRVLDDGYASSKTFLYLDHLSIAIKLVPLLKKKLHLTEFVADKLSLNLELRADGSVNWHWRTDQDQPLSAPPEQPESPLPASGKDGSTPAPQIAGSRARDLIVVQKLLLENINITYRTPASARPFHLAVSSCQGAMLPGEPLDLKIAGTLQSEPFDLQLNIASLEAFFLHQKSWMTSTMLIAETTFEFSGNIDVVKSHESLSLKAAISGNNLRSLNRLLNMDLPPYEKYRISASLLLKENHLELNNVTLNIGSSTFLGTATLRQENDRYFADFGLQAPLIQINDFIFADWSWQSDQATKTPQKTPTDSVSKEARKKRPKPLDPQLLALADVSVSVRADQVLSGEDDLGSGQLEATLHEGRIALEPLELNIPGGSIKITSSLKPGIEKSEASLTIMMSNFDISVLVHRVQPESDMGGKINLDINLTASASTFEELIGSGKGYFDFSGQLTNMKAGIIDLWAVNLISAIVSNTTDDPSQINCAVGRWNVENGLLTPAVFLVDTSNMRICGSGTVDLKNQRFDLTVTPKAKNAEFFSLATPVSIRGDFADVGLGIPTGGILGSAFRFIISPLATPIKRVILKKIPADGGDVCGMPLGPIKRQDITVPGCK